MYLNLFSFFFKKKLLPPQLFFQMSMIKKLIFVEKAVFTSFYLSRGVFALFFLDRRSIPYRVSVESSVLSSQENMSLPRYCRKDHLFKHSLHLFLRDTIRTKFTQQFRLFHTYGDVYASLITFMRTWIWERECLLNLSFLFRTRTRTLPIQNKGQISTQRFSVFIER